MQHIIVLLIVFKVCFALLFIFLLLRCKYKSVFFINPNLFFALLILLSIFQFQ
jgi:hypothetical protein